MGTGRTSTHLIRKHSDVAARPNSKNSMNTKKKLDLGKNVSWVMMVLPRAMAKNTMA